MIKGGNCNVLVVGAGPVGLAAALELARLKYPVRIVEKKTETSPYSKAMGINARTLELLEPSDVTKDLLDKGLRIPRANFFNRDRLLFRIDISKLKHRYNFMLSLPQSETERTIEKRLNEFGIEVERGVELINFEQSEEIVECVLLDNGIEKTFDADYVIGADGAHSTVRHRLGVRFPGDEMPGDWSLADVYMDCPLDNEAANAQFQGDGVFVMIRFGENLFRLASNKPDVLERIPSGSIIRKVIWQSDFTVSHRLVETYKIGRVFLAGDSAHVHSPLGGRGMNMGIEDATILARKIVYGGLELYSEERHKVGASAIRMIRRMTQMATSTGLTVRIIRDYILPTILNFEFIEQPLLRRMVGLG